MKLILLLTFLFFPFLSKAEEDKDVYKYLNLFGEAFEKIKNNYVEDVTSKDLIESAYQSPIRGLKSSLGFFSSQSSSTKSLQLINNNIRKVKKVKNFVELILNKQINLFI